MGKPGIDSPRAIRASSSAFFHFCSADVPALIGQMLSKGEKDGKTINNLINEPASCRSLDEAGGCRLESEGQSGAWTIWLCFYPYG